MNATLEKLHHASLTILKETGIRIHHSETLEILKQNNIRVDGDVAFFNADSVMTWINKAPEKFTLYARNPIHDMDIGGEKSWYGAGYGCPAIIDADGHRRNAKFEDYCTFLKLVHQSECFHLNGGALVQPDDLPTTHCFPIMMGAAIRFSDKCLLGFPGDEPHMRRMMEMMEIVFGGIDELKKVPRLITMTNTTSPLQLDEIALSTMKICAEYRQPLIISPGPIAGATGPITPAGNIALGNAELLAAIAITQMMAEGTPVVYGLQATTADMKTGGISIGSPGFSLETAWGARLAKYYGLPCRAGGASSDAKGVSVQSGYESMLAMFVSRQEQVNVILHSAGILDAYGAMSYEQFLVDTEIISMVDYYLGDITDDKESLAVDLIHKVGPGGQFLAQPHTFQHCRTVPWTPGITHRGKLPEGNAHETVMGRIDKKKEALLEAYTPPPLDEEIDSALKDFLKRSL